MIKEIKKEDGGEWLKERFLELEKNGEFDSHINPIDPAGAKPVDENFPYIPKGFLRFKYALMNFFVVKPFTFYQAKIVYKVKVKGKENLKGIKSAIVTSNHVAVFDCLVNAYVLRRHKIKTVAAEFNNRKGRFGEFMRVGGMIPLGGKKEVMRKFSAAVEYYLQKNRYVLFYPEQSMWSLYEKPRPYKSGAFHYAVKHNVPAIPMFITYRDGKKSGQKYFTVNIGAPVYPNEMLPTVDRARDMADRAYNEAVKIYQDTYGKKLVYGE